MQEQGFFSENSNTSSIKIEDACFNFNTVSVLRDVSLNVEAGQSLALLGPSGCGKTTLLRSIAGLEKLKTGTISINNRVVSSSNTFVPPEDRRVGMVFQDGALFPHLSVAENVRFGLTNNPGRDNRVKNVLDMVGLAAMADRSPDNLSGGERQRVALARALAPEPSVLLLDEPFASLDASMRVQLRTEVRQLLGNLNITSLFVTHDQGEAFVLGDQIAVMKEGQILQVGEPNSIYEQPIDPWVAQFVGEANMLTGSTDNQRVITSLGAVPLSTQLDCAAGSSVDVLLRPECLEIQSGGNWLVSSVEFYGHDSMYQLKGDENKTLQVRSFTNLNYQTGDYVSVRYVGPPTIAYQSINS
tara:strand:+ start:5184 stop:6254 length:1071 start_codon:yes stop_codon:yes gene_type:complete